VVPSALPAAPQLSDRLKTLTERLLRGETQDPAWNAETHTAVAQVVSFARGPALVRRTRPSQCFSDLRTWVGCWGQAGSMGRGDLTNAEWHRLESFLPRGGARGGRWSDHRRVINGVLYRVRTGVQWRDLPERFGPWETVYKRHRRWSADGTWTMLLSRVQAAEDAEGRIDWDVSVDSTAVRAHQHAAGARKVPPAAVPQKGAGQGTNRVDPVLRKLVVRLEEVIRSANAWDAPAAASPPKSTSPPRDNADPSRSF
jgi:transposase